MAVISFPDRRSPQAAAAGATWLDIARGRLRVAVGGFLNRVRVPGAVQPVDVTDNVTGQCLSVAVSALYTRITVNGRDYYFDRITGRFDGTGSSPSGFRWSPALGIGQQEARHAFDVLFG